MRLSKFLLLWFWIVPLAYCGVPEQPIPPRITGDVMRPAVFVMQADGGEGALAGKAIQTGIAEYYRSAMSRLSSEPKSDDLAKLMALLSRRANDNVIPDWVENIIVICGPKDIQVAFYPRNGGWLMDSRHKPNQADTVAFTCSITLPTWKVANHSVEAVGFKNFYENLTTLGLHTEYRTERGFEAPLNRDK